MKNPVEPLVFSDIQKRLVTREVHVGNLALGGSYPIRIQSMTNTDTNNSTATVAQCMALANAGCELVRITAQGIREAENLSVIKNELRRNGYEIPLVADIHFNPQAAETAARIVEKVRINPGNYVDKKQFRRLDFTEAEYQQELDSIAVRIRPLIEICKNYGTAIRVGVNHGSLGDRITSRYGNTAEGMVQSALEFIRIFEYFGFQNLVLSMKASNVLIMTESTQRLARRMLENGCCYPLHLGVTEAGDGEDGIIKSAVGIGTLLEQGIGDTLRVSLTGNPVHEIPVARAIAKRFNERAGKQNIETLEQLEEASFHSLPYREMSAVGAIGGNFPVQVITEKAGVTCLVDETNSAIGAVTDEMLQQLKVVTPTATHWAKVQENGSPNPEVLKNKYQTKNLLDFQVNAAIDFGSFFLNQRGNALWVEAPNLPTNPVVQTAFSILQATRRRITKTEYISCPSCGRTLFDIEKVLQEIKAKTARFPGLKIAVMGCIVNGPGEMADADFGYVGSGKGKVTLYKGQTVVKRNIPEEEALDELLLLINRDR